MFTPLYSDFPYVGENKWYFPILSVDRISLTHRFPIDKLNRVQTPFTLYHKITSTSIMIHSPIS